MEIAATLPPKGRDLRLDLFRGIANWWIYLDHISGDILNWMTPRNFGFSDAADLFVFISGYTASFVYAKIMLRKGFVVGTTRLMKRVWQLYIAHIVLFVVYAATIADVAERFNDSNLINEFNVAGLVNDPIQTLTQGLFLRFKPVNMDVLPLYIVLMASFAPVLWMLLRLPNTTLFGSFALYILARSFGWNLQAYPSGVWYFNPFAWQLLFVLGGWLALGGAFRLHRIILSKFILWVGAAYLLFALVMTFAGRFPELAALFPVWLVDTFNPNDKTNLAPYRILHFMVIAAFASRFIPRDWQGLEWAAFQPLIKCGQESLAVFCVGIFLSFVGRFILEITSGAPAFEIVVSFGGIAIMTAVAYYKSWSQKQNT